MASGPNKKAGGKLRRYSVWALTAAACLTVAVIGRHAFLTRVTDTEQLSVAEEGQKEAAEEARQDGAPDTAREAASGRQFHAAAEASATAQEAAGAQPAEEAKRRVLVIDDDPMVLKLIKGHLGEQKRQTMRQP